eukprot:TRINITY_DN96473_c0_g1_i1.p1 TRINITY_DN96473_c0_g1~~TRINITY_DN96473_c0_g1_i1.p1  ORF type:complete len:639 (-),score=167.86 TRINITY_DN96473_c0_g1_i1:66-1982(-)
MAKRAIDGLEESEDAKRAKVLEGPELEALVQERVQQELARRALRPVPPLLKESFTPNCPVHGLMHLPAILKIIVDTLNFQRMRSIKQLGFCAWVYPGAVHNRFFHSIGTAFLAYELVKGLRFRQPELRITDRDVLCASIAGLCHDLGHPCFSHMFEVFMHWLGKQKRKEAQQKSQAEGSTISEEDDKLARSYETWTHEQASVVLLRKMFQDLKGPLEAAGLRVDAEGDDFACIEELIDPPKKALENLLARNELQAKWSTAIKGRPVEKAWLYEIVSNWRSGIDVDKFDYFRRDAQMLGIHREFDHDRYMKGVKVVPDEGGVLTISPPEKDKDTLRENMMELRKMLHRAAYQHKTVKKLELHMVDVLKMMEEVVRVTGEGGKKLRISEAAVTLDPVAYPKLTDTFMESRLMDREDPGLEQAAEEYERRVVKRQLMRLVAEWDLPRESEEGRPFPVPDEEKVVAGTLEEYMMSAQQQYQPDKPIRPVPEAELRCQVAKLHYGMGAKDPITRIVFHSAKNDYSRGFTQDVDAKPLRQKIFVLWNPPVDDLQDECTLKRLTIAFLAWAEKQVDGGEVVAMPASPVKPKRTSFGGHTSLPVPRATPAPASPSPRATPAVQKPKRSLRVQASCPVWMDDPVKKA